MYALYVGMMLLFVNGGDEMQPDVAAIPVMAHEVRGSIGNPVTREPRPRVYRLCVWSTMPRISE